jgi:UDP-N-acetylglucosamine--N-acetylmuramyl-(pentapeptide) pyrophosphoryl-undecaprenol N-acetylglucosamine transferase
MALRLGLTGGGTGGHIYPCLALAEHLKLQNPSISMFYLGNPHKLEANLLKSPNLRDSQSRPYMDYVQFLEVNSEPLVKNPLRLLSWYKSFQIYTNEAISALKANKIDFVFGTGGYAAGPVFAACQKLKIPYIIHNLDAHMGLANRFFVQDAYALTLGVCDLGIKPKSSRVFVTGNPIANKFLQTLDLTNKEKNFLLVTGGSQGAKDLNDAIGTILPELLKLNLRIVHVTGAKLFDDHVAKFLNGNLDKYPNYQVLAYTHEMPELCSRAAFSVCRAGAMTISEMAAASVVPIFVPLPWAAHDHQNKNAASLVASGAALSVDQNSKAYTEDLLLAIKEVFNNLDAYRLNLKNFASNNAAEKIASLIL